MDDLDRKLEAALQRHRNATSLKELEAAFKEYNAVMDARRTALSKVAATNYAASQKRRRNPIPENE